MERRLTAILAADVVGYTRLMSIDEAGTLQRLTDLRHAVLGPSIKDHRGRLVKLMGDGLLVEFASLIDAVNCAIAWQAAVTDCEAARDEDERLSFRIGINLGDVIVEGEDIYGDGVNIASRLEALAEPGGICLSGDAYRQVRGKIEAEFEDLGEQAVKNVTEPLRVYRIATEGTHAPIALIKARPQSLPEKPSIAVLPFDNMSADSDQSFFADGITEDIITALSRMPWFFVIARNTTFAYKDRSVGVKQVASELGVKYVLEGSVRKSGNRLRITAQLIDGETGQHVWAERYDREVIDIFDVQDEVTEAIVGAIAPEFLSFEAKRARRKDQAQLDVWECLMRGRSHLWKLSRDDGIKAREFFQRARDLDPNGERGTSDLALVFFLEAYYRWSDDPESSLRRMIEAAELAVASDDADPWALTILSWANIFAHKWDESLAPVEQAVAISPNFAPAIGLRGTVQALLGNSDACIADFSRATRLSPRDSMMVFWLMGLFWAYHQDGNYREAEKAARQGIRLAPENPTFRRQLASALSWQGRLDEARAALAEYLRLVPGHTTADAGKVPCRSPEPVERFVEGLRRAGLPDPA